MSDDENDAVEVADEEPEVETETVAETEPVETATEGGTTETAEAVDDAAEAEEAEPGPAFGEDIMPDEDIDLFIPIESYLAAGAHIGTQQKTEDMVRFIRRVHDDGFYMLDVSQADSWIRTTADFLANYSPEQILVTFSRQYGCPPAEKFADVVGARARTGCFTPDILTSPDYTGYIEPDVVVAIDPIGDAQAVKKTITAGTPVIAMHDSSNQTLNVNFIVPTNNKGWRALSIVYRLLANEALNRRGSGTVYALENFEAEL